jgi:hypothetical protein
MITSLLIPTQVAMSQGGITFATMEIDLWPEYDSPEMLVIYRMELSPDVVLPVDLSIQIPAAAGPPNAVAVRDPNGTLLNAPYEREVTGEWSTISLTASMTEIQIEYYDPTLKKDGAQRNYIFTWRGDYPTSSLLVQFQQPFDARQVEFIPSAGTTTPGSDGLTYHTINLGPQAAGSDASVSIAYIKESDALTVEQFQIQPSAPISAATSGRVSIMDILPWGLGALGLILVGGGLWWYLQAGREKPKTRRSTRGQRSPQARRPKAVEPSLGTGDAGVYCHQCGKRAEAGDRFCRSCGTKLRAA